MLDLIISYINFLILSISYLVKRFTFNPPDPPRYKIVQKEINNRKTKNEILFLVKSEIDDKLEYTKLEPKYLNIEFYKIKNNKESLPILIITPKYHISICILYCQGNSGDLGTSLFECYEISFKCNCIIVTFEYPGYGICKNEEFSESEFNRRIKIVYNFIINVLNYQPNEIFLYGFSLGTGIAFDFACRKEYPVAGLILQSPFLSILRTLYDVKKTCYFDLFNNCDKAKKLCIKTLFIHSTKDEIVPYTHGKILAELIPQKYFYHFLTINNAGHNNLIKKNKKVVFDCLNEFISYCKYNNNININEYKNTDNNKYLENI
jgi:predicted alpha/beta hydrolase family esterase